MIAWVIWVLKGLNSAAYANASVKSTIIECLYHYPNIQTIPVEKLKISIFHCGWSDINFFFSTEFSLFWHLFNQIFYLVIREGHFEYPVTLRSLMKICWILTNCNHFWVFLSQLSSYSESLFSVIKVT